MYWSCEAKVLTVICFKDSGGNLIKTQNHDAWESHMKNYSKDFDDCSLTQGISSSVIIPTCIMRLNLISAYNIEETFSCKMLLICHQYKPNDSQLGDM